MGFVGFGRESGQNVHETPEVWTRSGGRGVARRGTLRRVIAGRNATALRDSDRYSIGATTLGADPTFNPVRIHGSNAWSLMVETLEELRVRQEINALNAARNLLVDAPQELPIRDEIIAHNTD